MRLWPILLDSQPEFLRGAAPGTTLLRMTLGADTVAAHLARWLRPITRLPLTVVAPASLALDDYTAQLREACPSVARVCSVDGFADLLADLDMSDVVLFVDPAFLPFSEADIGRLLARHDLERGVSHHLVAYDRGVGGTRERVSFDSKGRIRGIQRHYEPATWPFIAGVSATVVSVSSAVVGERLAPQGLAALRRDLALRGVPSRDVPIQSGAFRLGDVSGLLAANEHFVLKAAGIRSATEANTPIYVGTGHSVDPTARIIGPVVIHAGARVEANTTIIGPALVGAGASILAGAVVAHALIGDGCTVAAGHAVQDSLWLCRDGETGDVVQPMSYRDRLARLPIEDRQEDLHLRTVSSYARLKRIVDATVAALSLTFLAPLMATIAALIWLQRDGSIVYGDEREGVAGRVFKCWKFRTMSNGADAAQLQLRAVAQVDGPHFKMSSDPRVTRLGRLLRATNLDELPQLYNVLVGQMSLVGPRPSPFRENQICVPWRNARISVRPGITGMWQVCRHDRHAGDFHQWIEYDLLYVQHFSALVDLKIVAATFLTLGRMTTHVPPSALISQLAGDDKLTAA